MNFFISEIIVCLCIVGLFACVMFLHKELKEQNKRHREFSNLMLGNLLCNQKLDIAEDSLRALTKAYDKVVVNNEYKHEGN